MCGALRGVEINKKTALVFTEAWLYGVQRPPGVLNHGIWIMRGISLIIVRVFDA